MDTVYMKIQVYKNYLETIPKPKDEIIRKINRIIIRLKYNSNNFNRRVELQIVSSGLLSGMNFRI